MTNECEQFAMDPTRSKQFPGDTHSCRICSWKTEEKVCTPPGYGHCTMEDSIIPLPTGTDRFLCYQSIHADIVAQATKNVLDAVEPFVDVETMEIIKEHTDPPIKRRPSTPVEDITPEGAEIIQIAKKQEREKVLNELVAEINKLELKIETRPFKKPVLINWVDCFKVLDIVESLRLEVKK